MPRSRPPYSPEYRQQMVDLVRGGRARVAIAGVRADGAVDLELGPPGRAGYRHLHGRPDDGGEGGAAPAAA